MRAFPLAIRIAEVAREVAIRKNAYPGFVARGKLKQKAADDQIAIMQDVLDTLLWLREVEPAIKEFLAAGKAGAT